MVQDVSFKARAGEILGFAGLVGAGRTETMRAIFGQTDMKAERSLLKAKRLRLPLQKLQWKMELHIFQKIENNMGLRWD